MAVKTAVGSNRAHFPLKSKAKETDGLTVPRVKRPRTSSGRYPRRVFVATKKIVDTGILQHDQGHHRWVNLHGRWYYAVAPGLAATASYQRLNAPLSAGIGMLSARVAKSTVTKVVMSAAEKFSPAMKGTSASLASMSL
jgi:hypothetical protein